MPPFSRLPIKSSGLEHDLLHQSSLRPQRGRRNLLRSFFLFHIRNLHVLWLLTRESATLKVLLKVILKVIVATRCRFFKITLETIIFTLLIWKRILFLLWCTQQWHNCCSCHASPVQMAPPLPVFSLMQLHVSTEDRHVSMDAVDQNDSRK